ncbi:lipopolysaccharide kinase InaA family protein [Pseudomonas sp. JS3066]|uniref:lipopolysaccharide kinase InaA family protein n=1 Tax=Pseudomonas sp. JS3066 TaxID=3090665 RepID=UPI002E7C2CEF|nr:lipopolysaccharide kinase InaA family protein [Pseudomonas sp. JS3066]WVK91414.1 lipopolysaccharide kinase InaA family protein [Pseudomonas sp. JS3066]
MNTQWFRHDNGDAEGSFDKWWDTYGEWFDSQDQLLSGESGIQRLHAPDGQVLYSKRQINHFHRDLTHPFGEPTILHEAKALQALNQLGIRVPRVVFSGARKTETEYQALLVTESLNDFIGLDEWYAQPVSAGLRQQMIQQLANTVARMHRAGWEHGRLYPKNIFVKVTGEQEKKVEVALLGLARSNHRLTAYSAAKHDYELFKEHHKPMPDEDWKAFATAYRDVMESDYVP